jgi:hypothetical protein
VKDNTRGAHFCPAQGIPHLPRAPLTGPLRTEQCLCHWAQAASQRDGEKEKETNSREVRGEGASVFCPSAAALGAIVAGFECGAFSAARGDLFVFRL